MDDPNRSASKGSPRRRADRPALTIALLAAAATVSGCSGEASTGQCRYEGSTLVCRGGDCPYACCGGTCYVSEGDECGVADRCVDGGRMDGGRREGRCVSEGSSLVCSGGDCPYECCRGGRFETCYLSNGSECGVVAPTDCGGGRCADPPGSCPDGGISASDGGDACAGAAEGAPCDEPGVSCGGGACTDVCSFCNLLRCEGGSWRRVEVFAAPCFSCGDSLRCETGAAYCERQYSDVAGVPDSFACRDLPPACRAEPSCACLRGEITFDECVEPRPGEIEVRHFGG